MYNWVGLSPYNSNTRFYKNRSQKGDYKNTWRGRCRCKTRPNFWNPNSDSPVEQF